jgi:hypothetical protein
MNEYNQLNKKAPFSVTSRFCAASPDKRYVFLSHQAVSGYITAIFSFLTERDRKTEVISTKGVNDHTDESYRGKQDGYLAATKAAAALQSAILCLDDNTASVSGVFDQASFENTYDLSFEGSGVRSRITSFTERDAEVTPSVVLATGGRTTRSADTALSFNQIVKRMNDLQMENERLNRIVDLRLDPGNTRDGTTRVEQPIASSGAQDTGNAQQSPRTQRVATPVVTPKPQSPRPQPRAQTPPPSPKEEKKDAET